MILDKVDSVSRKYEKVFIFHIGEKKTRNSYVICPLNFSYFIFTKWQNAFFFHISFNEYLSSLAPVNIEKEYDNATVSDSESDDSDNEVAEL